MKGNKKYAVSLLGNLPYQCSYQTRRGAAFCADSLEFLATVPSCSVNLVLTSPPFALRRKKSYGNVNADQYIDWFLPFAREIHRILKPDGSFVLDIGGSWNKGEPTRSLYHFELLLRLCGKDGLFNLAQEFYWYNRAKMPAPAQWVTIERVRVKDAIQPIWWLAKTPRPKASNKWVLRPYSQSMNDLFRRGYNHGVRPSGHVVSDNWGRNNGGAIPGNVIEAANTKSDDPYIQKCRSNGLEVHPARFAERVPEFFIKFLTRPRNLVLDPFAGSNVVGHMAERLKRRWISIEVKQEYVIGSAFRFDGIGEKLLATLDRSAAGGTSIQRTEDREEVGQLLVGGERILTGLTKTGEGLKTPRAGAATAH